MLDNLINKLNNDGFINVDEFADTFMLSVLADIPIIYHGEGGYGKSEMLISALSLFNGRFGMLECDPETTSAAIKGGAIARTINQEGGSLTEAYYNVANSLLQHDYFMLEEVLDASFNALSFLKAVITGKKIHINGDEIINNCKILVCATNINPTSVTSTVRENQRNSCAAFLQRFMIVEHGWKSHNADDYVALYPSVNELPVVQFELTDIDKWRNDVKLIEFNIDLWRLLAKLAEDSANSGNTVSPRAFQWTVRLIKSAALLRGSNVVERCDFRVIDYLSYWSVDWDEVDEAIEEIELRQVSNEKLDNFSSRLVKVKKMYEELTNFDFNNLELYWHLQTLHLSITKLYDEFLTTVTYDDDTEVKYNEVKLQFKSLLNEVAIKLDKLLTPIQL
jgi:MoxR-like ATPase